MKRVICWICRAGLAMALLILLIGCGTAPVAESQSGTVGDTRPNETTQIDNELLRQVDAAITAARARGEDVSTVQLLRDSAVQLAQQGHAAEANGNLKMAAERVGVLRTAGGEPAVRQAPQAMPKAPAPVATGDEQGSMLLQATFADPSALSAWERIGPRIPTGTPLWEVQDGMLVQRGVDGIDAVEEQTAMVTGDANWRNVTVRASVLAKDTREVGLIVRQQGQSFYRFRALVVGTGTTSGNLLLEKVVDGKVTPLAKFEGPELGAGEWHTLAVTAREATIRCFVDGRLVGSADDAALATGRVGVSTLAMGGAYFANVQVIGR